MTRIDTANWTAEDLQELVRELEDELQEAENARDEAQAELADAEDERDAAERERDEAQLVAQEVARLWCDEATEAEEAIERGDDPRAVWQYFWYRTEAAQI